MILVSNDCIIIVDDTISVIATADFSERSVEAATLSKMETVEHIVERIRLDELPKLPRPRDYARMRSEPCNCPNDRARGPPHSIHIGFSHKPGLRWPGLYYSQSIKMKIIITIENCETVSDFYSHLTELRRQIKKEARRLKLKPLHDKFPRSSGENMNDANCYGEHYVSIYPYR